MTRSPATIAVTKHPHMRFICSRQVRRVAGFFALGTMIAGIILTSLDIKPAGITVLFIGICSSAVIYFDAAAQRRTASGYPISTNPLQSAIPTVIRTPPTGHPKSTPHSQEPV